MSLVGSGGKPLHSSPTACKSVPKSNDTYLRPLIVIKRLWGFAKVRYRGLAKNTARVFALMALANLYRVRHRLLPHGA